MTDSGARTPEKEVYTPEKQKSLADDSTTPSTLESAEGPVFDQTRTKKLLRKLDWHLVPFLALLYL